MDLLMHCFEIFVRIFQYALLTLTVFNPFLFFFATLVWVSLYLRTRKELDRSYLRSYALEKQVDFLVGREHPDREFFDYMKKTYKDLEERQ